MENILEQIKEECGKHKGCHECKLDRVCPYSEVPTNWDIEEIEKRLADGTKGEK